VRQFFSTLGAAHLQTHAGRAFQTKPQRSEVSRELDKLWQELGPQFGLVVSKVDTVRTEQSRIGLELTERFEASVRDLGQRAANINSALDRDRMFFQALRGELTQIGSENDRLRSESERLRGELTQIGSENDRLRSENERLRGELTQIGSENDRLRSQINALFHSRSWRITAPMRRITSLFRQSG
jgi:chromosome segregation ATPase